VNGKVREVDYRGGALSPPFYLGGEKMNRDAVYKPLLYSKGYWLMVDADNNLHWQIIAPDGDTVSAIADTVEGTKVRHSHIQILYSGGSEWTDTGLYSIQEVFRRVITPEV